MSSDAFLDEGKLLQAGWPLDAIQVLRRAFNQDARTYTLSTLPDHRESRNIYVSDATNGTGLTGSMCYSNGTVWIDYTTGAAVV